MCIEKKKSKGEDRQGKAERKTRFSAQQIPTLIKH